MRVAVYHWLSKPIRPFLAVLILPIIVIGNDCWIDGSDWKQKPSFAQAEKLAYTTQKPDGKTDLLVYDPTTRIGEPIHTDTDYTLFSFGADGRLAFSSKNGSRAQLYVLDTNSPHNAPVNISQDANAENIPLAWSPDGRYLAFASYPTNDTALIYIWDGKASTNITPVDLPSAAVIYTASWSPDGRYLAFNTAHADKTALIYVWDGKTSTNITPVGLATTKKYYSEAWSSDGQLAFTVHDEGYPSSRDPSEIYLWDGHKTINLSQNPTSEDDAATWSGDGRLAFLSDRDGKFHIFVSDDRSVKNGAPNIDTFTDVAPELVNYYSLPVWTSQGLLAFTAAGPQDKHAQIYLWNGQTIANISQNPDMHNSSQTWSADGRWAFATFFSEQQLIYVRAADNSTLFTAEGAIPFWSRGGYLAFCTQHSSSWDLSVWDGRESTRITQGDVITAQWQGENRVDCLFG